MQSISNRQRACSLEQLIRESKARRESLILPLPTPVPPDAVP